MGYPSAARSKYPTAIITDYSQLVNTFSEIPVENLNYCIKYYHFHKIQQLTIAAMCGKIYRGDEMKRFVNILLAVLVCLNLAFIWGNSLLDSQKSSEVSDRVVEVVQRVVETIAKPREESQPLSVGVDLSFLVRKAAHMTEFCLLAVWLALITRGRGRVRCPLILLAGMSTALIDETIQLFTGRGSMVADVWVDLIGFTVGLTVTAVLQAIIKRARSKRPG